MTSSETAARAQDGADALAQALYGRNARARDLLGGSNAKIFFAAAREIRLLRRDLSHVMQTRPQHPPGTVDGR